ncbi:MAG: class I SAM-dependent DNA methyltransferase [Solirubrobacterales bacterium]
MEALTAETRARLNSEEDGRAAFRETLAAMAVRKPDPSWSDGRDVVGEAFQRVVAADVRRAPGQFFTPLWVARAMAHWLLAEPSSNVLDPGCGSGSLLIAAAAERRDKPIHLLGVDSDPLAIAMAELTRGIRQIGDMELTVGNFLIGSDSFGFPDAVICNPPYTRHHDIPTESKRRIHEGFQSRLGLRLSGLSSLHVLFLVRALEVSAPDARLAFITPSHWLEMGYSKVVRDFLLSQAHVDTVVRFPAEHLLFPGVRTTAAITLIRKGVPAKRTRVIDLPGAASAANLLISGSGDIPQGTSIHLEPKESWLSRPRKQPSGIQLGDIALVRRGVATGFNSFFVLSEKRRKELNLRRTLLRPCATSPRHIKGTRISSANLAEMDDDVARWILAPRRVAPSGPLRDYLDFGECELGVTQRYLVRQRMEAGRRWFDVEIPTEAPILFTYFNRPTPRFVHNTADAVPLNSWLIVRPRPGVDVDDLFGILSSDDVLSRLQDTARVYGRGLWKLEPRQLLNIWLPPGAERLTSQLR